MCLRFISTKLTDSIASSSQGSRLPTNAKIIGTHKTKRKTADRIFWVENVSTANKPIVVNVGLLAHAIAEYQQPFIRLRSRSFQKSQSTV